MGSIRKPLLAAGLALTVFAVPALAQQPVSYPSACDASKVSKADVDRAHTVFLSGKQYLDESNYDKAISYFNDAYSIDCSVHAILPIIATAYERKGDKPEAVRALEEYLRRVPSASDREHVERRIKNLNDQIAREAPPPSATASASASAAPPVASAAPEPSATASAVAAPPPPSAQATSSGKSSVGPIVLTGVGGAAVVTGVILLVVGAGKVSDAAKQCADGHALCATQTAVDSGNSGRTLEGVGIAVGGVGIAAAAAGVIWLVAGSSSGSASSAAKLDGPVLRPVVAPGYAGLALSSPL
ncbi:MAG TPA: hypothetical protein VHV30_04760 [Polyangiaceae bacterium]|jgi:tetratricopeptide (TPR) repeat protein|nr:hypothetical protein [Polyangiaceae bacterium]